MARFFIDRPIFAWVIALVIMLAGAMAIIGLPVAPVPDHRPAGGWHLRQLPGGPPARTVEDSVTQIIEQNMTGLDHPALHVGAIRFVRGNVSVTLTFKPGTDPDIAQVQVQTSCNNRPCRSYPKRCSNRACGSRRPPAAFLMVAAFISTDGAMTNDDLADYVVANIKGPWMAGWTGSVTSPCSAASTPCASGWIPTSSIGCR